MTTNRKIAIPQIYFTQVCQIDERYAVKTQHQFQTSTCPAKITQSMGYSKFTLRRQIIFLFHNIFQQHPFYFLFLQCPLMIGITPGKHILELPGNIGGQSHIHRPVVHRTKHTHIRGNRVPQQ